MSAEKTQEPAEMLVAASGFSLPIKRLRLVRL
jgi:hypothetical protein